MTMWQKAIWITCYIGLLLCGLVLLRAIIDTPEVAMVVALSILIVLVVRAIFRRDSAT